jgi:NTE family protein
MPYNFKNLVFEGGGVKGIAYVGALDVLESKGILNDIERIGGTSAGAINAILVD